MSSEIIELYDGRKKIIYKKINDELKNYYKQEEVISIKRFVENILRITHKYIGESLVNEIELLGDIQNLVVMIYNKDIEIDCYGYFKRLKYPINSNQLENLLSMGLAIYMNLSDEEKNNRNYSIAAINYDYKNYFFCPDEIKKDRKVFLTFFDETLRKCLNIEEHYGLITEYFEINEDDNFYYHLEDKRMALEIIKGNPLFYTDLDEELIRDQDIVKLFHKQLNSLMRYPKRCSEELKGKLNIREEEDPLEIKLKLDIALGIVSIDKEGSNLIELKDYSSRRDTLKKERQAKVGQIISVDFKENMKKNAYMKIKKEVLKVVDSESLMTPEGVKYIIDILNNNIDISLVDEYEFLNKINIFLDQTASLQIEFDSLFKKKGYTLNTKQMIEYIENGLATFGEIESNYRNNLKIALRAVDYDYKNYYACGDSIKKDKQILKTFLEGVIKDYPDIEDSYDYIYHSVQEYSDNSIDRHLNNKEATMILIQKNPLFFVNLKMTYANDEEILQCFYKSFIEVLNAKDRCNDELRSKLSVIELKDAAWEVINKLAVILDIDVKNKVIKLK